MVQTTTEKNNLANKYATDCVAGSLYTTAPGSSAGTEVSGGSPAFARKTLSWGSAAGGVVSATATYDIPASTTVVGGGQHTATSGGSYLDGASFGSSQTFASQGTYQVTHQYTQT